MKYFWIRTADLHKVDLHVCGWTWSPKRPPKQKPLRDQPPSSKQQIIRYMEKQSMDHK